MFGEYIEASPIVKNQTVSIHIASIQNIQTAARACIDTIHGLENTQPKEDAWGATITSARETAKRHFSDRENESGVEIIEIINRLPPAQQLGAQNFYSMTMAVVNNIVNHVLSGLSNIDIKDCLAGNWTKLEEVDNDIKAVCDKGIGALQSMK